MKTKINQLDLLESIVLHDEELLLINGGDIKITCGSGCGLGCGSACGAGCAGCSSDDLGPIIPIAPPFTPINPPTIPI